MNSKTITHYPVYLTLDGHRHIILWQGDGPNHCPLRPGTSALLRENSLTKLQAAASEMRLHVSDEHPAEMDIDKALRRLSALRPARPASIDTCDAILNGWNMLEDLARSIGFPLPPKSTEATPLDRAYEKLFFGNNLPSVTPAGKSYHPTFTSEEGRMMRAYFRSLADAVKPRLQ